MQVTNDLPFANHNPSDKSGLKVMSVRNKPKRVRLIVDLPGEGPIFDVEIYADQLIAAIHNATNTK